MSWPSRGNGGGGGGGSSFIYPGYGSKFSSVVEDMTLVDDYVFGTAAVPNANSVSRAITSLSDVSTYFNALEGNNYDPINGTVTGGAGLTTINSEPQRYKRIFDGVNHIMDTDCLRLQATQTAGTWNSYLRTQIKTTANGGAGINVNAPGGSVITLIGDLTMTAGELATIEIGTTCTNGNTGLAVVTAKNPGISITLENATSGGVRTAYASNFHCTFFNMAFARVNADVPPGTTNTVVFKTALASTVVPGMFAMGVRYGSDPRASDRAKVATISGDRLTVTFTENVNFVNTLQVSNNDGVLFVPGLESGQIWTKKGYELASENLRGLAFEAEITLSLMSDYGVSGVATGAYSKAAVDAVMTAAPNNPWGYWPAVWLFPFNPDAITSTRPNSYCEIDFAEWFNHVNRGPSVWTGFLHAQPYTCRIQLADSTGTKGIAGSWLDSVVTSKEMTANAALLKYLPTGGMPSNSYFGNGNKIKIQGFVTPDRVIHYVNDFGVREAQFSIDTDYPFQWGLNVACGSMAGSSICNLFMPQTNAQATAQFMKIHSLKVWKV